MIFCNIWLNNMFNYFKNISWLKSVTALRFCKGFLKEFPLRSLKNMLELGANFKILQSAFLTVMTSACFSMCYPLRRMKNSSINNLFRGIPFSQQDKIHEHIQVSLSLGRRAVKGNLACCFHSFLQVFKRGFLQKISHFDGKEWPVKAA